MEFIIYMYLEYTPAMKLCRAFYGHGCTCDCTQVIPPAAAVCLGSCEPAGPCAPGLVSCLIAGVFRWFEVSCALKAHLAGEVQGSAVSSQSVLAPLSTGRSWMCTFSWPCHGSCVRTCLWGFLVGVCMFSSVAFEEAEKTAAEAEQLIGHSLLVYAFYSTLNWSLMFQ